jgi:hypothetical protein
MKMTLLRFVVSIWCGWLMIQAPYVGKEGFDSDPSQPLKKWDLVSFGHDSIPAFDTAKECEEAKKRMIKPRPTRCVPIDWFKPHAWWQFWK